MRRAILVAFVLLFAADAASELMEADRLRYIGVQDAVELIRELRPDWRLSSDGNGRCGGDLFTRDGGWYPGGVSIGGYTFVAAPLPNDRDLELARDPAMWPIYVRQSQTRHSPWNMCLVDSLKNVRWEAEAGKLLCYDLTTNGTVAVAERISTHVVGVRVFNDTGRILFADVWLAAPPVIRPRGYVSTGSVSMKFSPTARWLVMTSSDFDSLGVASGSIVRVLDRSSDEVWLIRLEDCDVSRAEFPGPETAELICTTCTEDGRWRIYGPGEERVARTLNLESRALK